MLLELNLRGNDITRLTQNAFNGALNLKRLDLSHNALSFIDPLAFVSLQALQDLNLSHNKLSNQSFSYDVNDVSIEWTMESLTALDLSYNKIMYYDAMPFQSFSRMANLESLFLQHNEIPIDFGVFTSNRKLKTLDFSYNHLPYFDLNFLLSVRSLENLYLNGNGISYATQIDLTDIRLSFPHMKRLAISDNKFACEVLASIIRKSDKIGIELFVDDIYYVTDQRNIRGMKCN
jgi:Leucine-rich repeat (LRR) protein